MPTLDFKGKPIIYAHHLTVPSRTLEPDAKKSLPPKGRKPSLDDNLIIHGDNLHALKALMPRYAGRVNCIYIDPPYNIGNEGWIYNDNVSSPMMKEWLKDKSPVDGEDLERHDKWLCMMWPRLQLLRELLAEDGVIFVSIDDNEQHRLRMVMDEIFGEKNFVGAFVWEGTGKNDSKFISVTQDYIVVYARNFDMVKINKKRWRVFKRGLDEIYATVEALQNEHGNDYGLISAKLQEWFSSLNKNHPAWKHKHYDMVDEKGIFFPGDISWPGGGGPRYEVLHPDTKKAVKIPAGGWRFPARETMLSAIKAGRVYFGKGETSVPNLKRYLHETDSQVLNSVIYQDRRAAHKRLKHILTDSVFDYPKDERVLELIFEAVTDGASIVLDSFAGSGTTAHAVLKLNNADGGNRKFILVECGDNIADKITAERVRRVIRGIPRSKDESLQRGLGGSFTWCALGDELSIENMLTGRKLPDYETLARHIFWTATGQSPDTIRKARGEDGLFHETKDRLFYLIYEPETAFLRSNDSALNSKRAGRIAKQAKAKKKTAVVFATHKFMGQKELGQMGITFAQLPYCMNSGG